MDAMQRMAVVINETIDKHAEHGDGAWNAYDVALAITEQHPDLIAQYLHENRVAIIRDVVSRRSRSQSSHNARMAPRNRFRKAVNEAEEGNDTALRGFAESFAVSDDNTRKRVADMVGADHSYVADKYAQSADTSRYLEVRHRAVARKIGSRRTSEVFTEAEYTALFEGASA